MGQNSISLLTAFYISGRRYLQMEGQPVSASLRQMQYKLLTPAASKIQLQNKTKFCQIVGGMDANTCKHYVTSL